MRETVRRAIALVAGASLLVTLLIAPAVGQSRSQDNPPPDLRPPGSDPDVPGFKRAPPDGNAPGDKKGAPAPRNAPSAQLKRRSGSSMPDTPAKRAKLLNELYAQLATADDEQQAKRTSDVIEQIWLIPASPTVGVLIERAARAAAEKRQEVARQLLDSAAKLAPDYPEVFVRRAYLYHSQNDILRALGDIRRALALDPNHFKALEAMAQMLKEIGQPKAALTAFRRLLEVHPYWPGAKGAAEELKREVEGQEI